MIDPDALNVWHEQHLVGSLWRTRVGYIGFRYDPDWIAGGGFADRNEARAVTIVVLKRQIKTSYPFRRYHLAF